MSVFAGPVDILVTGLALCVATAVLVAPILHLRAPVHTHEGVSRVWIERLGSAYDRVETRYRRSENAENVEDLA